MVRISIITLCVFWLLTGLFVGLVSCSDSYRANGANRVSEVIDEEAGAVPPPADSALPAQDVGSELWNDSRIALDTLEAVVDTVEIPAEVVIADTRVLDTEGPDTRAPETVASDTTVPDTQIPDMQTPDTSASDTQVPEVELPDTNPPSGDCCTANGTAGCGEPACHQAVCAIDSYCCTTKWDGACAKCAKGGSSVSGKSCEIPGLICDCPVPEPPAPTPFERAEHWAPVWYHDTDEDDYEADFMTAYDFDGDEISDNNWENLHTPGVDLSAVVYWAYVETTTHWFLTYLNFHPRDWAKDCTVPFQQPCHENDMEGAMVVVRKDGTPFGAFEALYTEAHNTLHIFTNNPLILVGSTSSLEGTLVTFEDETHPELYVESKGHGVCALYFTAKSHCKHSLDEVPPAFGDGDGVVYRYTGVAETPEGGTDMDVGYALVPFESTLWPLRFNSCGSGCMFDGTMSYDGVELASAFDGDTYGDDKARPPWSWDDPDDGGVYQGDHFFRPAKALATHLSIPDPVSQQYLVNPYLFSLQ